MQLAAAIANDGGPRPETSMRAGGARGPQVNTTPERLRGLIPQGVPGCCLVETLTPIQRYQGYYPGAVPRGSCSRQWGGQGASATRTQKEALDEVVQWLWWAHKRFGQQVPAPPSTAGPPPPVVGTKAAAAAPQKLRGRKGTLGQGGKGATQGGRGQGSKRSAAAAAPVGEPQRRRRRASA